ncbi:hypothetical protein MLD38_039905 [Melastoma candidum]|uniref:Uncharacterized protein n=1 Tax=Melastoma candidum TaxID=119954 RepID=A0ACB9L4G8_9MYRT|nr:hypothetical protein MLD38_039905 [Melastoma candidum]
MALSFHKKYLDLVWVTSGLLIEFVYNLYYLQRYLRNPDSTVMGIENNDKRAWVDSVMQMKLEQRTVAVNVIAASTTAATFLSAVSLTLCSLIGTWIANPFGSRIFQGMDPETASIKYISILACFVLAFAFFLQSARHFIHASYLISTNGSSVHADDVKTVVIRGGEFWALGLRAIYFAMTLLLWFFGPIPMFVSSAILSALLFHHDIHSIPLKRRPPLKIKIKNLVVSGSGVQGGEM